MKGFSQGLALKQRRKETQTSPIKASNTKEDCKLYIIEVGEFSYSLFPYWLFCCCLSGPQTKARAMVSETFNSHRATAYTYLSVFHRKSQGYQDRNWWNELVIGLSLSLSLSPSLPPSLPSLSLVFSSPSTCILFIFMIDQSLRYLVFFCQGANWLLNIETWSPFS